MGEKLKVFFFFINYNWYMCENGCMLNYVSIIQIQFLFGSSNFQKFIKLQVLISNILYLYKIIIPSLKRFVYSL